nr:putative holin [Aggregatibacter actinomycetemcomitans]
MKGFFNTLKHGRLLSWVISALCLLAIIGVVSPVQLPVVLYKLALVSVAAIIKQPSLSLRLLKTK